jgi:hypothetical protein
MIGRASVRKALVVLMILSWLGKMSAQVPSLSAAPGLTNAVHQELSGAWDVRTVDLPQQALTRVEVPFSWGRSRIPLSCQVVVDLGDADPSVRLADLGLFVVKAVTRLDDGSYRMDLVNALKDSDPAIGTVVFRSNIDGTLVVDVNSELTGYGRLLYVRKPLHRHFGPGMPPIMLPPGK